MMYNDTLDLLLQNKYVVSTKIIDDRMIVVDFPKNIFTKPKIDQEKITYIMLHDGVDIIKNINNKVDSINIKCRDYVKRTLITKDIYLTSIRHDIDWNSMCLFDKDDKLIGKGKNIFTRLEKPFTKHEQELEHKLKKAFIAHVKKNQYVVDDDIKEGFDLIIKGFKV